MCLVPPAGISLARAQDKSRELTKSFINLYIQLNIEHSVAGDVETATKCDENLRGTEIMHPWKTDRLKNTCIFTTVRISLLQSRAAQQKHAFELWHGSGSEIATGRFS